MRETKRITIDAEGRDSGKVFVIREMPAMQAEKWAMRLLLALARAGIDVSAIKGQGMAGVAAAGIMAMPMLDFRDAEPLMDEMMGCVQVVPDPGKNPGFARDLVANGNGDGDDIQEVATLITLRGEILELHTRFFTIGTPPASS